ncbi:MAG: c-type cytochrome biogenesis protein CcsB [Candidatus Omnitrophota bacterium]
MHIILFSAVLIAYFLSLIAFAIFSIWPNRFFYRLALSNAILGFILHSGAILKRAYISGFAPMSNLYESIFIFAWAIVLVFLIIEYRFQIKITGIFIMPTVIILMVLAALLDSSIKPLIPALQSYWLFIHVIICFLAYACFACACGLGLMYLLQERQVKLKKIGHILQRLPALDVIDRINYNLVFLGFIFLSFGIITGSIWAQQAWGSWWSWDPKESWALITWIIYAAYLHVRIKIKWHGRNTAILSIIGFISVLFTYFGVSFLLSGLHSYL